MVLLILVFVILPFIAGALKAIKDVLSFKFQKSVFPDTYWWKNKIGAPFGDAWHTADFLLWVTMLLNVVFATFTEWHLELTIIWILARWFGFQLFYYTILIKKDIPG